MRHRTAKVKRAYKYQRVQKTAERRRKSSDWAVAVATVLAPLLDRLWDAIRRAGHLVQIYRDQYGAGRGRRSVQKADLLRAAVVFLHAAFEEYLRGLATLYYPNASEAALNDIPLAGLACRGRPEKFFLGKLIRHRSKSVEQVIRESVAEYLAQSNFNDVSDVTSLLESLEVPITDRMRGTFPVLQQLMKRRHQIVHKADRVDGRSPGKQRATSISLRQIDDFVEAIQEFSVGVTAYVIERETDSNRKVKTKKRPRFSLLTARKSPPAVGGKRR